MGGVPFKPTGDAVVDAVARGMIVAGGVTNDYKELATRPEIQQALRVVGGAFEVVSGVIMIINPFVPVGSQLAGIMLIGHGIDTLQAGSRSLESGKEVQTLTYHAASKAALNLGADARTADTIGIVADNLPGLLDLAHGSAQGLTRPV